MMMGGYWAPPSSCTLEVRASNQRGRLGAPPAATMPALHRRNNVVLNRRPAGPASPRPAAVAPVAFLLQCCSGQVLPTPPAAFTRTTHTAGRWLPKVRLAPRHRQSPPESRERMPVVVLVSGDRRVRLTALGPSAPCEAPCHVDAWAPALAPLPPAAAAVHSPTREAASRRRRRSSGLLPSFAFRGVEPRDGRLEH